MRRQLDAAFPTLARYLGLVLMTALTIVTLLGRVELPVAAIFVVPFGSMILYKRVHDADQRYGERRSNDYEERWSHLE